MATYPTTVRYMAFIAMLLIAIHVESDGAGLQVERTSDNAVSFRFYLQDVLQGRNQTVWEVAKAEITPDSKTNFGEVRVVDDLITLTHDYRSAKLGRAQGLIAYADLHVSALHTDLIMHFTWGRFKGSTLCITGRNDLSESTRELAIVGGTGVFRLARGYAISKLYSYDVETNHGVIEYQVFVYLGHRAQELLHLLASS